MKTTESKIAGVIANNHLNEKNYRTLKAFKKGADAIKLTGGVVPMGRAPFSANVLPSSEKQLYFNDESLKDINLIKSYLLHQMKTKDSSEIENIPFLMLGKYYDLPGTQLLHISEIVTSQPMFISTPNFKNLDELEKQIAAQFIEHKPEKGLHQKLEQIYYDYINTPSKDGYQKCAIWGNTHAVALTGDNRSTNCHSFFEMEKVIDDYEYAKEIKNLKPTENQTITGVAVLNSRLDLNTVICEEGVFGHAGFVKVDKVFADGGIKMKQIPCFTDENYILNNNGVINKIDYDHTRPKQFDPDFDRAIEDCYIPEEKSSITKSENSMGEE